MTARRMRLPAPEPYTGAGRCPACHGRKLTGARYEMPTSEGGPVIVVDEICPACDGCGRAVHDGCEPREHGEWEYDAEDDDHDDGPPLGEVCLSCHGRHWWACTGFDQMRVHLLRVPCGCAEKLMVDATAGGGS